LTRFSAVFRHENKRAFTFADLFEYSHVDEGACADDDGSVTYRDVKLLCDAFGRYDGDVVEAVVLSTARGTMRCVEEAPSDSDDEGDEEGHGDEVPLCLTEE
jgi:hypothetical protein